jgi:dihydroorotate dehydrogenase (NAD+) catalytic subunit
VQVGTVTFRHPGAMIEIIDGLAAFCAGRNIPRVAELTGAMQREEADEVEVEWLGAAQ